MFRFRYFGYFGHFWCFGTVSAWQKDRNYSVSVFRWCRITENPIFTEIYFGVSVKNLFRSFTAKQNRHWTFDPRILLTPVHILFPKCGHHHCKYFLSLQLIASPYPHVPKIKHKFFLTKPWQESEPRRGTTSFVPCKHLSGMSEISWLVSNKEPEIHGFEQVQHLRANQIKLGGIAS